MINNDFPWCQKAKKKRSIYKMFFFDFLKRLVRAGLSRGALSKKTTFVESTWKMSLASPTFYFSVSLFLWHTLEFVIDGTLRLLVILFFATLPNLIQHSPFINFRRNLPVSPFIPDSLFINSCAQSTAVAWSLGKAMRKSKK